MKLTISNQKATLSFLTSEVNDIWQSASKDTGSRDRCQEIDEAYYQNQITHW